MVEVETLVPEWFDPKTYRFDIDFINDIFTGQNVNLTLIKDLQEDARGSVIMGQYGTTGLWYPSTERMPSIMPALDSKVMFEMAVGEKDIVKVSVYVEITNSSTQ